MTSVSRCTTRTDSAGTLMAELLQNPKFLKNVLATLEAWAAGLVLAALITVPLGILIGTSDTAYKMSSPVIEFMRPIPSVALIPIGILLWGQGFSIKIILVAYATSWPILFNTIYGVHDVDPIAVQIKALAGLLKPTGGIIRFQGETVQGVPDGLARISHRIGASRRRKLSAKPQASRH